jgi:hypothetical protein
LPNTEIGNLIESRPLVFPGNDVFHNDDGWCIWYSPVQKKQGKGKAEENADKAQFFLYRGEQVINYLKTWTKGSEMKLGLTHMV